MPPDDRDLALLETAAATPRDERDVALLETAAETQPASAAAPDAQLEGHRIGRFTALDKLGAGAMGVVWRAEDPKLGRPVALKLLKRADAGLTERLVREARAMAQVNHPNVVTVYEVGEADNGTMFIAMELVTGTSLRAWQTKRPLPELVAAYIAAARGLAAAHAAGIVHRDFKPDNVLVGDDGRVRVTDFGLAAARTSDSMATPTPVAARIGDVNLTTSGSVLGTPAYMAPEQFTGGNVDSRTDQFNFCVALYEAVYGARPFAGSSFTELGDNVIYGRMQPPPANARVSNALRDILLRGLSTKPGDRFATMDELIVELGRDRARPWRWTAIAASAVAAALGVGLVADWTVRDRLESEIITSFALTGKQLERAVAQLIEGFDRQSDVAYTSGALREVASHRDQAEFGLGSPDDDRAELERLHAMLASADWSRIDDSDLAVADYKGRLLFTTAAPDVRGTDLTALPSVKRALDAGQGDSITVVPYDDPALVASRIAGDAPHTGLAFVFMRTLSVGDKGTDGSEARALYLQLQDGKRLLDNVRLDEATQLALVAATGEVAADPGITPSLARQTRESRVTTVEHGDTTYLVQAREVRGPDAGTSIAHVVMARPLDGVLSLFPGARLVFALTASAALVLAAIAYLRARSITNG